MVIERLRPLPHDDALDRAWDVPEAGLADVDRAAPSERVRRELLARLADQRAARPMSPTGGVKDDAVAVEGVATRQALAGSTPGDGHGLRRLA